MLRGWGAPGLGCSRAGVLESGYICSSTQAPAHEFGERLDRGGDGPAEKSDALTLPRGRAAVPGTSGRWVVALRAVGPGGGALVLLGRTLQAAERCAPE